MRPGWRRKSTGKGHDRPQPSGGGMWAGETNAELCATGGGKPMRLSLSFGLAQPGLPAAACSHKVTLVLALPSSLGEEAKGTPSHFLPSFATVFHTALYMPTLKLLEVDSPHPGCS